MAGNQQGLAGAIATRQQERQQVAPATRADEARAMLDAMAPEFGKVLADSLPVETFVRLALTECRTNPQLLQCSAPSLMGALMTAARLNLEPGGPLGQFYLTPRRVSVNIDGEWVKQWQVVPIIGYRGLRDLALRTRLVTSIQPFIIREGDKFVYGSNETRGFWHEWTPLDSDEDQSDRPWKGVLTIAQLPGSAKPVWRYLDRKAVLARKARGAAGDKGPWKDDEEAMVRKTGIRAIAPDLPSSSVMQIAMATDERVQVFRSGDEAPTTLQHQIEPPPAEGPPAPQEPPPAEEPPPPPAEEPQQQPRRGRGRAQAPEVAEPPVEEPPDPGPWTPPGPDGRV